MKRKRKILTIFVILLILAIPISIAQAGETTQAETNNETISLNIVAYQEDGKISTETITLTKTELLEFENAISTIMDKIQSGDDWSSIKDKLGNLLGGNRIILNMVTSVLFKFKTIFNRALVISSGHGYNINPIKKNEFKIRKSITMWRYSSENPIKDRTIFIKPLSLKMKTFRGAQIGIMSRFTGIYLHITRTLPEKSYTFFFGTAKRINGVQLPSLTI